LIGFALIQILGPAAKYETTLGSLILKIPAAKQILGQTGRKFVRQSPGLDLIPLKFCFKRYDGPGGWQFYNYGAGVVHEIFWWLVLFLIWPKRENCAKITLGSSVVTCFLEALQLYIQRYCRQLETHS